MDESAVPGALECAVCLQTCIHPTELPCGHIFCFLCVKGVANQSKRCAMCRNEIPSDFLKNPKLVKVEDELEGQDDLEYQWYYEGKNGWWKYDARTNAELDAAFRNGARSCEMLIAGFLYVVDFDTMLQLRRNDPLRRRKIKRDAVTVPSKGVAGIRMPGGGHSSNVQLAVKAEDDEDVPGISTVDVAGQTAALTLDRVLTMIGDNAEDVSEETSAEE